jgi:kynureninase
VVPDKRVLEPAVGVQDLQQVLFRGVSPVVLGAVREADLNGHRLIRFKVLRVGRKSDSVNHFEPVLARSTVGSMTVAPKATSGETAESLERSDPVPSRRAQFHIPRWGADDQPVAYFAGNSLGCQPVGAAGQLTGVLDDWARLAVSAHEGAGVPWLDYPLALRQSSARLVGASAEEVVLMNGLTVNLHVLLATFYRPSRMRYRIVIEDDAFPSDSYAVAGQAAWHGLDPDDAVVRLRPREGEDHLRTEDVLAYFRQHGDAVAVSLLGGVNYRTGAVLDMSAITRAARAAGCAVGWDLAHAVGNVPVRLHEWGADFAVWCTYKYLNGGPGSVGGAFVHDRHAGDPELVRLGGWWGNDPGSRFDMRARFAPGYGAAGWQISNPPLLAMAPLQASLALFDETGLDELRGRSRRLSAYLDEVLDDVLADRNAADLAILTPREHARRGCQVSVRIPGRAATVCERLKQRGVVCDHRGDSILRVAPVPLYSTYADIARLGDALHKVVRVS